MTAEESKKLRVGDKVCFDGDETDRGRVTAIGPAHVTIKWDDGHQSFTGHKNMVRIERINDRS